MLEWPPDRSTWIRGIVCQHFVVITTCSTGRTWTVICASAPPPVWRIRCCSNRHEQRRITSGEHAAMVGFDRPTRQMTARFLHGTTLHPPAILVMNRDVGAWPCPMPRQSTSICECCSSTYQVGGLVGTARTLSITITLAEGAPYVCETLDIWKGSSMSIGDGVEVLS